jgi:hypothetical protein
MAPKRLPRTCRIGLCQNSLLRDKNFANWPSSAGWVSFISEVYTPQKPRAKALLKLKPSSNRSTWAINCVYLCMFQRHTKFQRNMKLALLLITMSGSALSRQPAPHLPLRVRAKPIVPTDSNVQTFSDTRRLALLQYFQACSCPAAQWTHTFIKEADRNGLDWRLVASIAMIESTGGKRYKNRNILGWRSASMRFRSEPAGIEYVSSRLHNSPLYARKSLVPMLRTYNSKRRNYVALVTGVMRELAAAEDDLKRRQVNMASSKESSFPPAPH